jgi:hypothetical protein
MSQPSVTVRLGGGTPSQHMTGRGPGGPGGEPLGPPEPGDQPSGPPGPPGPRQAPGLYRQLHGATFVVLHGQLYSIERLSIDVTTCYVPVTWTLLLRHKTESSEDP